MAIFSKETAMEVAYIGAGAVAGKIVGTKVYDMLPSSVQTAIPVNGAYVEGAIPVLAGLFLPSIAGRSTLVRGLANGMIASGASTIVGQALSDFGVGEGAGMEGVGNVMMGNVMMSGADTTYAPLMGSTEGADAYNDNSYDFTSADAGEMNF
jgi:hypothetical protein